MNIFQTSSNHLKHTHLSNCHNKYVIVYCLSNKNNNNHNNLIAKHAQGGQRHTGSQLSMLLRMPYAMNYN